MGEKAASLSSLIKGIRVRRQVSVLKATPVVIGVAVSVLLGCAGPSTSGIWTTGGGSTALWKLVGPAGLGMPSYVATASIAVDHGTGALYAAFEDSGTSGFGTVVKFAGGAWNYVGSRGFTGAVAGSMKIAVATDGTVYVAFATPPTADGLNVMSYTSANGWQQVGSANFDTIENWQGISLALDRNNVPYVAFVSSSQVVKVDRYTAGSWTPVGSPSLFQAGATTPSLAIDSAGNPWVAYEDGGAGNWASVLRFDGSSWSYVAPPPAGPGAASTGSVAATSLALNAADQPYLACWDGGYGGLATVKTFVSGTWINVGNPGFSAGNPYGISMELSPGGVPLVAYQDGASGDATVMTFTGTIWAALGRANLAGVQVQNTALALDAAGTPYIVFTDQASGLPSVMTYQ